MIPYVVFGISLLLLFHSLGIPLSFFTVRSATSCISLPYTILVLVPRLDQIDISLEEAARDLGASRLRTFRTHHPAADPARRGLGVPDRAHGLVRRVRGRVVRDGTQTTFPIYLYGALRFPSRLPEVIAVAVVVMTVSLIVVVGAEIGRRVAEGRLGRSAA